MGFPSAKEKNLIKFTLTLSTCVRELLLLFYCHCFSFQNYLILYILYNSRTHFIYLISHIYSVFKSSFPNFLTHAVSNGVNKGFKYPWARYLNLLQEPGIISATCGSVDPLRWHNEFLKKILLDLKNLIQNENKMMSFCL